MIGTYTQLRVWWIPQIPGDPFYVSVQSVVEAVKVMNTLALYDIFQYENKIKPDYANAGGVQEYDTTANEWCDWLDEETGIDDPREYLDEKGIKL